MPARKFTSPTNADQRLSQLIQLKKLERPEAEFWAEFEQELRSKQLSSLVQVQPLHTRIRRACLIVARRAAPPTAAAGAIALTFFAASNIRYLSDATPDSGTPDTQEPGSDKASEATPFFIVENVASEPETAPAEIVPPIDSQMRNENLSSSLSTPVSFLNNFSESTAAGQIFLTEQ